jgi:hypothetical protein
LGVVWLRSLGIDQRLVGEWTFLTTDGTNYRRFIAFGSDGTVRFEQENAGDKTRVALSEPLRWWMEDDVVVLEQTRSAPQRIMNLAVDTVDVIRRKRPQDRADYRLKLLERSATRLLLVEVSSGVIQPPRIEMLRVENPPAQNTGGN